MNKKAGSRTQRRDLFYAGRFSQSVGDFYRAI